MLITTTVYFTLLWKRTNYFTQQALSRFYSISILKNTSRSTMMDASANICSTLCSTEQPEKATKFENMNVLLLVY